MDIEGPSGLPAPYDGYVPLPEVLEGQCGIVTAVEAEEVEADRLKAMGVCLGRKVMLVQAGDPLILKVLGSRIGVSARLAARVLVDPCAGDAPDEVGGDVR